MTLKDIAVAAAVILQADDIEYALTEGDKTDFEKDGDLKCMLCSANLAVKEACADGFPILREVEAVAENKRIPLSAVPNADSIKSVVRSNKRCSFCVDNRGISVPRDGRYTVVYSEAPRDLSADDEVTVGVFGDKSMLAYLTARDYCLMTGRTDEAAIWDQRYVAESEKRRLKVRAYLPAREWR
ncbi:MAG: hypothetical protein J1F39_02800 [Clostridiales bacterium]|nr:hypothetical protein [Clostridiales bacterium]